MVIPCFIGNKVPIIFGTPLAMDVENLNIFMNLYTYDAHVAKVKCNSLTKEQKKTLSFLNDGFLIECHDRNV